MPMRRATCASVRSIRRSRAATTSEGPLVIAVHPARLGAAADWSENQLGLLLGAGGTGGLLGAFCGERLSKVLGPGLCRYRRHRLTLPLQY
jgi:hypothetical protein